MARTWLESKSVFFFRPKISVFGQKSDFCHMTPILVNDPFLALGMMVNFPHWERFFDFPFRSYSSFRKKIPLTAQKVFPLPIVGAPAASNSPCALSEQALRARAVRARAGKHQQLTNSKETHVHDLEPADGDWGLVGRFCSGVLHLRGVQGSCWLCNCWG